MFPDRFTQPVATNPDPGRKPVLVKIRLVAAWLLCFSYFYMIPIEFSALEWKKTGEGLWLVTEGGAPGPVFVIQLLLWMAGTFLAAVVFLVSGAVSGFYCERKLKGGSLQGGDLAYYFAWFQILTFSFLIVYPTFAVTEKGWLSTILPYFPHVLSLALAFLLFRSRLSILGFRSLPGRQWLGVLIAVGAGYAFVSFLLDPLVTEPVARALSLEMASWREDSISQGLSQAAEMGWVFGASQILLIGVIGPIAEEIMFRGLLMGVLAQRVGVAAAIFLSSAVFSLSHVDVAFLAPLFVMGLIMGTLYAVFRNLWVPILFHMVNNTVAVVLDLYGIQ